MLYLARPEIFAVIAQRIKCLTLTTSSADYKQISIVSLGMEFVKSHLRLRTGLCARADAEEKARAAAAAVSCAGVARGVGPF